MSQVRRCTMTSTRHLAFFLAPILALQACAPAAEPGPTLEDIEAEVRVRSEALVAAEMAGEYQTAVTFFTPDVVVQAANVPQIQGRDPLLEMYETVLATTSKFEGTTTNIVAAASGDSAYECGVNRFVFAFKPGTLIYRDGRLTGAGVCASLPSRSRGHTRG